MPWPYSGLQSEIHEKRVHAQTYIFMEGNRCYRTGLFDPYWENIGLEFHRLAKKKKKKKKEKNKANMYAMHLLQSMKTWTIVTVTVF